MSDWRAFRPAIWLAMLGVALTLLVHPPYLGAVLLGAAIGVWLRIWRRRRNVRLARGAAGSGRRPDSRRGNRR